MHRIWTLSVNGTDFSVDAEDLGTVVVSMSRGGLQAGLATRLKLTNLETNRVREDISIVPLMLLDMQPEDRKLEFRMSEDVAAVENMLFSFGFESNNVKWTKYGDATA